MSKVFGQWIQCSFMIHWQKFVAPESHQEVGFKMKVKATMRNGYALPINLFKFILLRDVSQNPLTDSRIRARSVLIGSLKSQNLIRLFPIWTFR